MKLYYHEFAALVCYLISISILIATGRSIYPGGSRIVPLTITVFLFIYAIMWFFTIGELFFNRLLKVLKSREIFNRRIKAINTGPFMRFILGAVISFQISITAYSNFKQNIWTYTGKTYDENLFQIDSKVHIGKLPLSHLKSSKALKPFATLIDNMYYFYFPNKILMLAIFLFILNYTSRHLHLFLLGQNLLWGVGVYLYLFFPALGPCYYHPEIYAQSSTPMFIATSIQHALLRHHEVLLNYPETFMPVPYLGISAMPSFHVAASFYYLLASFWIRNWGVRLYCGFFFVGIFLGSIYTGWHYFLDGIAGMIWAGCIYLFVLFFQHYTPFHQFERKFLYAG